MSLFQTRLLVGDGYGVVSLIGELDLGTAPTLRAALNQVMNAGLELVVVDASELDFIDTSGLAVLVGAQKRLSQQSAQLVIANLPARLYKPIRVTGLDRVIPTQVTDTPSAPWAGRMSPIEILGVLGFAVTAAEPTRRAPDDVTPLL